MKARLLYIFLLISFTASAQVDTVLSQFNATINLYAASGSGPTFTIQGIINNTTGQYDASDVAIGDIIFASEADRCVRLRVDNVTVVGQAISATVTDLEGVVTNVPLGIAMIARETANNSFPLFVDGVSADLLACVRTHFTLLVDNIEGEQGPPGADTDSIYYTLNDSTYLATKGDTIPLPTLLDTAYAIADTIYFISGTDTTEVLITDTDTDEQNLSLVGDSLLIQRGTGVDLSVYRDTFIDTNTDTDSIYFDNRSTIELITRGDTIALPPDLVYDGDSSITNELQDIDSVVLLGNLLTVYISNGASASVDLSGYSPTDRADTSGYNLTFYIQNDSLNLTDAIGNLRVDLSPYLDNTDTDSIVVDSLGTLLVKNRGDVITLITDTDTDTDEQNLSLVGDSLLIERGTGVDLSVYLDNTDTDTIIVDSAGIKTYTVTRNGTIYIPAGDGTGTDTSGYNQSFTKVGDSLILVDGTSRFAVYDPDAAGGGFVLPTDSITFNNNEAGPDEAELNWDSTLGYLVFGGLGNQLIQIGQDQYWMTVNQSGGPILKGEVVRAAGATGNSGKFLIEKYLADGNTDPNYLLGVAAHDIPNGSEGYVMHQGKIRQIDLTAYTTGQILYVSPTVAGDWVTAEPSNGYQKLPIAFVVDSSANGTLAVRVKTGEALRDLHDVDVSSPADGDLISYDSVLGYWVTKADSVIDDDADSTNELQFLSLDVLQAGLNKTYLLTLSNDTTIQFTDNVEDNDADKTNEGSLTVSSNTIISNTEGSTDIQLLEGDSIQIQTDGLANSITISNTAPDKVVSITGSGATTVTGTYPNFTISSTDNVIDNDNDPTNELDNTDSQELGWTQSTGVLTLDSSLSRTILEYDGITRGLVPDSIGGRGSEGYFLNMDGTWKEPVDNDNYVDGFIMTDDDNDDVWQITLGRSPLSDIQETVDLSKYLDNTDTQDLEWVQSTGVLTLDGSPDITISTFDGTTRGLVPDSDGNSGKFLSGDGTFSIPVDNVNDADSSATNEITTIVTSAGTDSDAGTLTFSNLDFVGDVADNPTIRLKQSTNGGQVGSLNSNKIPVISFNDRGIITNAGQYDDPDPSNENEGKLTLEAPLGTNATIKSNTANSNDIAINAGNGINLVTQTGVPQSITIVNSNPDQQVAISGSGATTVTGTYPNFTISSTDNTGTDDQNITGSSFDTLNGNLTIGIEGGNSQTINLDGRYLTSATNDGNGIFTSSNDGSEIAGTSGSFTADLPSALGGAPSVFRFLKTSANLGYANLILENEGAQESRLSIQSDGDENGTRSTLSFESKTGTVDQELVIQSHDNAGYFRSSFFYFEDEASADLLRLSGASGGEKGRLQLPYYGSGFGSTTYGTATSAGVLGLGSDGLVRKIQGSTNGDVLTWNSAGYLEFTTPSVGSTPNDGTLTLSTSGIATGSATFTADQSTNTTFTVNVPATNIEEGSRNSTVVQIVSSTGSDATLSAASTTLAGVMTAADKTKLNGIATGATANTGTVTSVAATAGSGITISGSPITTSGTLTITNSLPNATHSGDVTGSGALTIATNVVSNAKLSDMTANTIKGRITTNGDPQDLTASQVRTIINVGNGADITGVTAGNGLTGGATIGNATLDVGAGSGIDVADDAISVDVSDFMDNGVNNRIVTATGTDGMNAEASLTFDGTTLEMPSKLTAGGVQMVYNPDAVNTSLNGSMVFGNGGGSLTFSSGAQGQGNTLVGFNAGLVASTAYHNTIVGAYAGDAITSGFRNTAIGYQAGSSITTGQENTLLGFRAGVSITSAHYNTMFGTVAGELTTGTRNNYIGHESGRNLVDDDDNTFQGYRSGFSLTSGSDNVIIGSSAATINTIGDPLLSANGSIYLGANTRGSNTNGNDNEIAIGQGAVGLGSNTTVIGNNSTLSTHLKGLVTIGDRLIINNNKYLTAYRSDGTTFHDVFGMDGSNTIIINRGSIIGQGASSVTFGIGANRVFDFRNSLNSVIFRMQESTGNVGIDNTSPNVKLDVVGDIEYTGTITDVSDERLKFNIENLSNSLEKIMSLSPVKYNQLYDNKIDEKEYGLIAQDVQKQFPEMVKVVDNKEGVEYYGLSYTQLIAPIIQAMQEQQAQIEELKARISELENR